MTEHNINNYMLHNVLQKTIFLSHINILHIIIFLTQYTIWLYFAVIITSSSLLGFRKSTTRFVMYIALTKHNRKVVIVDVADVKLQINKLKKSQFAQYSNGKTKLC